MSEGESDGIPGGFEPIRKGGPFLHLFGPLYPTADAWPWPRPAVRPGFPSPHRGAPIGGGRQVTLGRECGLFP